LKIFNRNAYRSYSRLSVAAVFILILLGGIVRSTGSGMGCPDWPKCFGQYIPPTQESQLPEDYQESFTLHRVKKAEKFASLLHKLGFSHKAEALLGDPSLYEPELFNARKTWIEYINRLWGALTGIFALLALISSFSWRKWDSRIPRLTALAVVLIFFNAWMGSIVVSTNLMGWVVTVHYLLAYVAVFIFMVASYLSGPIWPVQRTHSIGIWISVLLAFTLFQIVSGTALREITDTLIGSGQLYLPTGEVNVDGLGIPFNYHRILALLVLMINLRLCYRLWKSERKNVPLLRLLASSLLFIVLQIISGSMNLQLNFPVMAQVHHIFGAGLLFGIQSYVLISFMIKTKPLS
jgi:cytochrome c oxidase assembly protein subunit 15